MSQSPQCWEKCITIYNEHIYITHYIPIGQSQTRICLTWTSNISYISFAKSCIGQLVDNCTIYWKVSKRGYGHSAHAVPTHQSSVNVLNENIINISPFFENIDMFSHRLIFIMNNIFAFGWLTVHYRLYWTKISYIGPPNIIYIYIYNVSRSKVRQNEKYKTAYLNHIQL